MIVNILGIIMISFCAVPLVIAITGFGGSSWKEEITSEKGKLTDFKILIKR